MKKNLSILFCLSFCSTVLPSALPAKPNANTELARIVDVVKAIHNASQAIKKAHFKSQIQDLFNKVRAEITPINEDIHNSMVAISKATEQLLNIANDKQTDITSKNFASKILQPCYKTIVNENLKGGILIPKKLDIKNLTSDTQQKTETLKHQTVDILNRIFVLWHLSQLLFNIPTDSKIALQWPNEDLTIKEWQALTQQAINEIWNSTEQVKNAKNVEEIEKNISDVQAKTLKKHEEGLKKIKAAHEESLKKIKSKSEELSKEQKIKALTQELKEKYPTKAAADKAIIELQKQLNTLYVFPADQRATQKEALEEKNKILKSIAYSVDPLMDERLLKEEQEIKNLLEIKKLLAEEQSERAKILAEEETEAKTQEIPQLSWWDRFTKKTRSIANWTKDESEKFFRKKFKLSSNSQL
jgi:hypothetical protein